MRCISILAAKEEWASKVRKARNAKPELHIKRERTMNLGLAIFKHSHEKFVKEDQNTTC